MNKQQVIEILKGLTVAGGFLPLALVQFGIMEPGKAEQFAAGIGSLISLAGIIWMAVSKTDSNMVKDASTVPGVQVHVNTRTAPPAVVEVARDPDVTDVKPMVGGPRVDRKE